MRWHAPKGMLKGADVKQPEVEDPYVLGKFLGTENTMLSKMMCKNLHT